MIRHRSSASATSGADKASRSWVVLLAVICGILMASLFAARHAFRVLDADVRAAAHGDLLAAVNLRREQVEAMLFERKGDASIITNRNSVRGLLDPAASAMARQEAKERARVEIAQFVEAYGYKAILLLDPSLHSVLGEGDVKLGAAERIGLAAAIRSGKPSIVDVHAEPRNGLSFGVAAPILAFGEVNGLITGVVYLEVDAANSARSLIGPWLSSYKTLEVSLLRRIDDKIRILSLRPEKNPERWRFDDLPFSEAGPVVSAAFADEVQGVLASNDDRGRQVIAASAHVADTPWRLLATVDLAEIDIPVRRLAWTVSVGIAVFIIFSGALALVVLRRQRLIRQIEEAALARRYVDALTATSDAVLRIDATGRIQDANPASASMTGYTLDALRGMNISALGPIDGPGGAAGTRQFRTRWRSRSGDSIDIEGSATVMPTGDIADTYIIARDVTTQLAERARLEHLTSLHRLLQRAHQAVRRHDDPVEILTDMCVGFLVSPRIPLIWAGWVDREAGRVVPVAVSGPGAGYVHKLNITLDPALPTSQGPTGQCAREGSIVIAPFIQRDQTTAPWHQEAARHQLASSIALPVLSGDAVVAVLTIYSDQENYFQDAEFDLAREMSETLTLALDAVEGRRAAELLAFARAQNEARLRRIFQAAPIPMHIFSADSNLLTGVNTAFVRLFGYGEGDFATVAGWLDAVCVDPTARATYAALRATAIAEAAATGRAVTMPELTLRCRDGGIRTVQAQLSVAGDEVIKTWTDLTEIRVRERALRRREEIYTSVVEQSSASIAVIDAVTGQFLEFNATAYKNAGYSRDEFANIRISDVLLSSDHKELHERGTGLAPGESVTFTTLLRHRDGREIDVRVSLQRLLIEGRLCEAVLWADITEERRRVRIAAEEAERHRILFDNAAHGIVMVDTDFRIIQANTMLTKMLRCDADQIIGTQTWDWNTTPDPSGAIKAFHEATHETKRFQFRIRRADSTEFDAEIFWNVAVMSDQNILFISITDISDRLREQSELRRSERLSVIGQLTSGIAHDFNNLLTTISLNIELAIDFLGDDHKLHNMLSAALNAARRGGNLNGQLLTFAGRQSLRPVATDLGSFIPPLQAMAARAIGPRYNLTFISNGDLPPLMVDQAKLENSILNLIINARDAMSNGGDITIEATAVHVDASSAIAEPGLSAGDHVMLTIADNGPGMPPEVREHAFEAFFTTKPVGKGTGLGLSMVMGFVTQSGGHVTIDSTLGKGTAIRLYFPVMPAVGESPVLREEMNWSPGPLRTLLIEDQPDVRAATVMLCRSIGLVVETANSAEEALSRIRDDDTFLLLFIHGEMPGPFSAADLGHEALKPRPNLKLLFASGFTESKPEIEPIPDREFLAKPYGRQDLLDALRRLCGQGRTVCPEL